MHKKTQEKVTTGAGTAEGCPAQGVRTSRVEWLGVVNDCIGGQVGAQWPAEPWTEGGTGGPGWDRLAAQRPGA